MTTDDRKIRSFTDLIAWQKGHKFVLGVYKVSRDFPKDEQFALTSQIRRAVVSYTSNIAEGFARSSSREKQQFYSTALGSLVEVENQLLIARDLEYISKESFTTLAEQAVELSKLVNGLLKHTAMSRSSRLTSVV